MRYRIAGNFRGPMFSQISTKPQNLNLENARSIYEGGAPKAILENIIREIHENVQSAKILALENYPLYGTTLPSFVKIKSRCGYVAPEM